MKSSPQAVLPLTAWLVVWLAPIVALPIYLFAFIGAGWSVSGPHFPVNVLFPAWHRSVYGGARSAGYSPLRESHRFGNCGVAHPCLVEFCRAGHRLPVMENWIVGDNVQRNVSLRRWCDSYLRGGQPALKFGIGSWYVQSRSPL